MFEMESKETVLKRLIEEYQKKNMNGLSAIEGTFSFDTMSANSVEFEKTYAEMSLMIEALFAQTSWGNFLTMLAEMFGVVRREATQASVVLDVSGAANATVPDGSLFSTEDGKNFISVGTVQLDGKGKAKVKAKSQNSGKDYNVSAGLINKIPITIYGVNSVNNYEAAYDGYDEEDDETLRERLFFKVRQPATSGNENHYKEWATSIAGVGNVKVKRLWNGNGTVKVIIADINNKQASADLVKKVAEYIEEKRPIGATVTVVSPELLVVNVSLKVTKGVGDAEAIKSVLEAYFTDNGFDMGNISLTQIGRIILDNSITTLVEDYDYTTLKLNGTSANIAISDEQLPQVGEVTLIG